MARPIKKGLDYFPLDTQLDTKLKLLKANQGFKGYGLLIRLYQIIYQNGYYIDWNDDIESLFKSEEGFARGDDFVSSVINYCLNKKIFDKDIYTNHSILTSKGIQERYIEIKKGKIEMEYRYFLLKHEYDTVIDETITINDRKTLVFTDLSTQRKEKESKEKESKVKESKKGLNAFDTEIEKFKISLYKEFKRELTLEEERNLKYLINTYTLKDLTHALRSASAYDNLSMSYISAILKGEQDY